MRTFRPPFFILAGAMLVSGVARAEQGAPPTSPIPRPHAYAVVVGSNAGGAGQAPLRFAEDDATRVAEVLREIGHYDDADVRVLLHPDAAHVVSAIDDVGARVRANAAAHETSSVVFYYSGHARANAVTLGAEDIALSTLRERLSALPSTLTIVVLDACQSGAFARIKGAEPAADFTYNSVARLTQKGLAVMASSTSQELSQESDELKASYFTHHLLTALRGAGDADRDGRVSLDEAYRYAYRRTLASTARTQVGEQHVTLETDLAGQGDVPVTYPAEAKAQLELPGPLDARVLVQHRASGAVVAEIQKAKGSPIRLALIAGAYDAIVRQSTGITQCRFALADDRVTPLDTSGCTPVAPDRAASKGDSDDGTSITEIDRWAIEGGLGVIWRQQDGYTQTLEQFGYRRDAIVDLPSAHFTLGASRIFVPHLSGLIQLGTLAGDTYTRAVGGTGPDSASFSAYGGGIYIRAYTDVIGRALGVYAQAGGGLSVGSLTYKTQQTNVPPTTSDGSFGYLLGGAAGMTVRFPRYITLFAQVGYDRAPAIRNLIGDTHDSGGPSFSLGLRVRLGEDP